MIDTPSRTLPRANCGGLPVLAVGLALGGATLSAKLLADHDGGWSTAGSNLGLLWGLCESAAMPSVSCADVVGSPWGAVDLSIQGRTFIVPTSFIGLAYFSSIAIWLFLVAPIHHARVWLWRLTLGVVSLGFVGSIVLLGVMALRLSEWCTLCVYTHVVSGSLFFVVLVMRRRATTAPIPAQYASPLATSPSVTPRPRMIVTALIATVAVTSGLWLHYDASRANRRQFRKVAGYRSMIRTLQRDRALTLREFNSRPVQSIPPRRGAVALVSNDPAATLVVFENFECTACKCFDKAWRKVLSDRFSSGVRVDHRHALRTPFDDENHDVRARAVLAARAVEAARIQGGARGADLMRDLLYKQHASGPRDYTDLARRCRLDSRQLVSDMDSDEVRGRVDEDLALAVRIGVTSTPMVFLNGRQVPELCLASHTFWDAIAELESTRFAANVAQVARGAIEIPQD